MKYPTLPFLTALAGLLVSVPFAVGAVIHFKTGTSPEGFVFGVLPGFGLGIIALLGNALVAQRAVASTGYLRWLLASCWLAQFAAMLLVFPVFLLASVRRETVHELVTWIVTSGDLAGWITLALYGALTIGVEITVPALLISTGVEAEVVRQRKAVVQRHEQRKVGRAPTAILEALAESGELTKEELADKTGYALSTTEHHLRAMRARKMVESRLAGRWGLAEEEKAA